MKMADKRRASYRVAILNVAEGHARRFRLTILAIGAFFFGYYFFAEVWPALLRAGSGEPDRDRLNKRAWGSELHGLIF